MTPSKIKTTVEVLLGVGGVSTIPLGILGILSPLATPAIGIPLLMVSLFLVLFCEVSNEDKPTT